jgi:hypothetical protein
VKILIIVPGDAEHVGIAITINVHDPCAQVILDPLGDDVFDTGSAVVSRGPVGQLLCTSVLSRDDVDSAIPMMTLKPDDDLQ